MKLAIMCPAECRHRASPTVMVMEAGLFSRSLKAAAVLPLTVATIQLFVRNCAEVIVMPCDAAFSCKSCGYFKIGMKGEAIFPFSCDFAPISAVTVRVCVGVQAFGELKGKMNRHKRSLD